MNWRRVRWYWYHTLHPRFVGKESVVLDLGANRGRFSQVVSELSGARCIAVEPSPELSAAISESALVTRVQCAIAGRDGALPFHLSSRPLESSARPEAEVGARGTIVVPAMTIESLATSLGLLRVDVIKMDIEGMEIEALDACGDDFLKGVGQLSIEFHDFIGLTPATEVRRVVRRLTGLGFASVRMSRVGHQDTWFINRRRCAISIAEIFWIRWVVRNVVGLARVLGRWTGRAN